jgi:MFS family permease
LGHDAQLASRALRREWAAAALLLGLALALASALIGLRAQSMVSALSTQSAERGARQVAEQAAKLITYGIALEGHPRLQEQMARVRQALPQVVALQVVEAGTASTATGRVLASEPHASPVFAAARGHRRVEVAVEDAQGSTAAHVQAWVNTSPAQMVFQATLACLLPAVGFVWVGLLLLLWPLAKRWQRRALSVLATDVDLHLPDTAEQKRRALWLHLALGTLLIALAYAALLWRAQIVVAPWVSAQLQRNTQAVVQVAAAQIEQALALGVPLPEVAGLNEALSRHLSAAPELAQLDVQRLDGTRLAVAADERAQALSAAMVDRPDAVRIELLAPDGTAQGRLNAIADDDYVASRLRGLLWDLVVLTLVVGVLLREAIGTRWQHSVIRLLELAKTQGPSALRAHLTGGSALPAGADAMSTVVMRARAPFDAARLRWLVFLVALSDELLRPFFSVLAGQLPASTPWLAQASVAAKVAWPVMLFMLALAVSQPLAPWLASRVNLKHLFVGTALACAVLLYLTTWAPTLEALTVLRAASGLGYGLLLLLAQTWVVRQSDFSTRARTLSELSVAIVAAGICGPVLGGLIADQAGYAAAFLACAMCATLAAVSASLLPPPPRGVATTKALPLRRGLALVLQHRVASAVIWFAAVPARLSAAVLLVVWLPLQFASSGLSAGATGYVLTLYFVVFWLAAPWAAARSDVQRKRWPWVVWGGAVSGLACVAFAALPAWIGPFWAAALASGLLGLGQAMQSAAQLAWVTQTFDRDPNASARIGATPEQALAAFRFVERAGSVAAPVFAAVLAAWLGAVGVAWGLVAVMTATTAALVAFTWNYRHD